MSYNYPDNITVFPNGITSPFVDYKLLDNGYRLKKDLVYCVSLTSVQLLALNFNYANPLVLVPSQGEKTLVLPRNFFFNLKFNTKAYAVEGDAARMSFSYGNKTPGDVEDATGFPWSWSFTGPKGVNFLKSSKNAGLILNLFELSIVDDTDAVSGNSCLIDDFSSCLNQPLTFGIPVNTGNSKLSAGDSPIDVITTFDVLLFP